MTYRSVLSAAAIAAMASGCNAGGTVGTLSRTTADVRVINASAANIDVLQGQSVSPGDGALPFGSGSQCMTVELVSHGLSVRQTGATGAASPLPSFTADGKYAVIVSSNGTALQLLSLRDDFIPSAGSAAIRLINVTTSTSFDVYVTAPGAALGTAKATAVVAGTASSYFDVSVTAQQIRLTTAGSTAVAIDLGNVTLVAGSRAIIVVAPPLPGATAARTFIFTQTPGSSC